LNYTLVFQYSNDNINWYSVLSVPIQSYQVGVIQWFTIPTPVAGTYFRVSETGGATLNIQELYFNSGINDTLLQRVSRNEYVKYPNKNNPGKPSLFYVERHIVPMIYLYQVPNSQYNNLFFSYIEQMQDIGNLTNIPPIPARALETLVSRLAFLLALKKPDIDMNKLQVLKYESEQSFKEFASEDRDRGPIKIHGRLQGYYDI